MKKHLIYLFFLLPLISFGQYYWNQIGQEIVGEFSGDTSGCSVSMSSDGSIVAVGAKGNDGNGNNSGHTRIFQYDGSSWNQLGQSINGEAAGDQSGGSVSLSADGMIVAIGAPGNGGNGSYAGHVRVFQYDGSSWNQLGQDIDGEAEFDTFGASLSISADGMIVAIGAPGNDGNGSNSGHTRIFQYDGNSWSQLGQDIDGEAELDSSGGSVSLSADGMIVAIGAYKNGENGNDSGHTRIFQYDGSSWIQLGQDIDGENAGDRSGYSVSISGEGSIVAVSSYMNSDGGENNGKTRVFQFDGTSWVPLGQDIIMQSSEVTRIKAGFRVTISKDGSTVAILAMGDSGIFTGFPQRGFVQVYKYNGASWIQEAEDIGEVNSITPYSSDCGISLSSEGNRIAIGYSFYSSDSGKTKVYELQEITVESVSILPNEDIHIYKGSSFQLSAFVLPEDAVQEVIWSTVSGTNVSVTSDGLITGWNEGVAVIRAESVQNSQIYDEITVTVDDFSITISPANEEEDTDIYVAEQLQLVAQVLPEEADQEVTWSISSGMENISIDQTGLVTGLNPGVAVVEARSELSSLYGSISITVYNTAQNIQITTITGEPAQTYVGGTLGLQAAVLPEGTIQDVIWSIVSGEEYGSIDENGVVSGVEEGTILIKATSAENESVYSELEIPVLKYCVPYFAIGCEYGENINDFVMEDAGIEHYASGCSNNAYGDFTSNNYLLGTLQAGQTYPFTITHEAENMFVKIWIDLNDNGSFEDEGELLFSSGSSGSSYQTIGSFTVPSDAEILSTRMRILAKASEGNAESCSPNGQLGETHDYMVTISEEMSVSDIDKGNLVVYPNPTSGMLEILSPVEIEKVQLFNLNGNKMMEGKSVSLDISSLPSGIYLIKILLKNGEEITKTVIKK